MTNEERDEKYEVVWAGGEGLVEDRLTKPNEIWQPRKPTRIYNKTGNHTKKGKSSAKLREGEEAQDQSTGEGASLEGVGHEADE